MKTFQPSSPVRAGVLKPLLWIIVALVALIVVAWIFVLPRFVQSKLTALSGFPTEAATISTNPFTGSVHVEKFQLQNPTPQFPVPDFVNLELLDLRVRPLSLLGDRMDIPHLRIEIPKITIVTNAEGVTNAMLLKQRVQEATGPEEESREDTTTPFVIGDLVVRVGSIESIDYSKGDKPVTRTYLLNIDRHFTNVTDARTVAGPIVADVLRANVGNITEGLASLLPPEYENAFTDALQSAAPLLRDASGLLDDENADKMKKSVKKIFDSFGGKDNP